MEGNEWRTLPETLAAFGIRANAFLSHPSEQVHSPVHPTVAEIP